MYRTPALGFWQTMVTAANNKGENDRYMDHQVYLSQTHHIHEECGVFGVYAKKEQDLATLAYYGLYALQHRGQESAGIVVNDDGVFSSYRDVGLVNDVFSAWENCGRTCALRYHRQ